MSNLSFSKNDIHLYVDGEMPPEEQILFEAWLKDHPDMAREVRNLQALNESLHDCFDGVLDEPLPARLEKGVSERLRVEHRVIRPRWQMAASLAFLVSGGALGWFANDGYRGLVNEEAHFLSEALEAHSIYVPEVRHPVEVSVDDKAHLLKWLSKRLGNKVRAPDLSAAGYNLVGGRLLPGEGRVPSAQFMYENEHGKRLTFFMMPVSKQQDSSFQYYKSGDLFTYLWTDQPFQYAMTGSLRRDELRKICELAYKSLES